MGTKRQDPMAICFTNRTKGAPTLVEYSQHVLAMGCSQASRSVSAEHSCVETGSQEPMAIYFTSGTTASPKMAQHSQSSLGTDYTLCGRLSSLRYNEKDIHKPTEDTYTTQKTSERPTQPNI
ncbi:acyl-coenzyme A synthetase ACSM5, mitochondrial-like isoform X2 [Equus caballus]|uniref:acyl-coenzyme A synthetase ACSM5, mitochondrial-like isoform X2 n=1 Tax=Equus caballus TaxID=9796 RepID=UPI0038B3EF5B